MVTADLLGKSSSPDRLSPDACPVCGAEVVLRPPPLPTYIAGGTVDVYECSGCRLLATWPQEVPTGLYEAIYRHAGALRGYVRYTRYARHVARESSPLRYLSEQEDMYWAVDQFVGSAPDGDSWRMIDIGSGLGYLTAALRSEGYDCIGIDVSTAAVERAKAEFGPWYERHDVFSPSDDYAGAFDVAFVLETIEHVPDPVAFLAAVKHWLRPGGRILVTTPNRDTHPLGARWRTDLPPVHLYWFTERAVDALARRIGLLARHVDFTAFNRRHEQAIDLGNLNDVLPPSLGTDLQPLRPLRLATRVMERLQEIPFVARAARSAYDRSRPNQRRLRSRRSFAMAAILEPPASITS